MHSCEILVLIRSVIRDYSSTIAGLDANQQETYRPIRMTALNDVIDLHYALIEHVLHQSRHVEIDAAGSLVRAPCAC